MSVTNDTTETAAPERGPLAHPWDEDLADDCGFSLIPLRSAMGASAAIDVLDSEGDRVAVITHEVALALRDLTAPNRKLVLRYMIELIRRRWSQGFDVGVRCGKEETLNRVHELLGVQKIADAIREAAHGK